MSCGPKLVSLTWLGAGTQGRAVCRFSTGLWDLLPPISMVREPAPQCRGYSANLRIRLAEVQILRVSCPLAGQPSTGHAEVSGSQTGSEMGIEFTPSRGLILPADHSPKAATKLTLQVLHFRECFCISVLGWMVVMTCWHGKEGLRLATQGPF